MAERCSIPENQAPAACARRYRRRLGQVTTSWLRDRAATKAGNRSSAFSCGVRTARSLYFKTLLNRPARIWPPVASLTAAIVEGTSAVIGMHSRQPSLLNCPNLADPSRRSSGSVLAPFARATFNIGEDRPREPADALRGTLRADLAAAIFVVMPRIEQSMRDFTDRTASSTWPGLKRLYLPVAKSKPQVFARSHRAGQPGRGPVSPDAWNKPEETRNE